MRCSTLAIASALLWGACRSEAPVSDATPVASRTPASDAQAAAERPDAGARGTLDPGQERPAPLGPLRADQMVSVPGGTLRLGSAPTVRGRVPENEALRVPTEIAGFRIDRLPYPNDPGRPATVGLTRQAAAAQCAAAGKRLCSEAEWEWACQAGALDAPYPTGARFTPGACAAGPTACQNGWGLMAMGTALREWTASDARRGIGHAQRTAVLRGANAAAPAAEHRCAARSGATPDSAADDIGFRCCQGAVPNFQYPTSGRRPLVAALSVPLPALRAALATVPALKALSSRFEPYRAADANRALARGEHSRATVHAWHIADPVFQWSPGPGLQLWVVSGASADQGVLAVLYRMPDGSFVPAASAVFDERDTSLALGYTEDKPRELMWTTCYGCPGEGGQITAAADGRIDIQFH